MDSTAGIFLFGVPCDGLNHENLLSIAKHKQNFQLISDLMHDSSILRYMVQNFNANWNLQDRLIVSFYETHATPSSIVSQ